MKTEPLTVGAEATVYSMSGFWARYTVYNQKPNISRCICASRDRLGFYADIQNNFGTLMKVYV